MDGIPVKISEKYKPPRTITLPACIRNKINSTPTKFETYDFKLERSVIERVAKLEELRKKQAEKRAKKLEILKKFESLRKQQHTEDESTTESVTSTSTSSLSTVSTVVEETTPPQEIQILTPIPIISQNKTEPVRKENKQDGNINLSDFENDTSSPFDNIELKTINEMEELAHVLGSTNIIPTHTIKHPTDTGQHPLPNGFTNHWHLNNVNNYSYMPNSIYMNNTQLLHTPSINNLSTTPHISAPATIPAPSTHLPVSSTTVLSGNSHTSHMCTYSNLPNSSHHIPPTAVQSAEPAIPHSTVCLFKDSSILLENDDEDDVRKEEFEIIKGLKRDLEERRLANKQRQIEALGSSVMKTEASEPKVRGPMPNAIAHLCENERAFAKNMAEMGFPLPRVVRAIQRFGINEAKVVEYLLQVQSLLDDKKFQEEQIEKALQLNDFEEDKTRQYLESFKQIMNLGFKEDDVAAALARTSDRDKALDILIS